MSPEFERSRLGHCPDVAEIRSVGADLLTVRCADSKALLERAGQVLDPILTALDECPDLIYSPEDDHWRKVLPEWFLERFCTVEEIRGAAQKGGDAGAVSAATPSGDGWALESWLPWFEPDDRPWYWFGACSVDQGRADIYILAHDYPILVDALEWFLYQCGGLQIERGW